MERRYLVAVAAVALVVGCLWLYLEVIEPRRLERDCAAGMLASNADIVAINASIQLCIKVGGIESYQEALRKYEPAVATDAAAESATSGSAGFTN